ncbi:hypothetical protein [Actinomadura parmotrematis]|uniref:Uncharacterized protein n=1 Tax=Actinomadura parmotrematis TaxID=2864039 RepID=A0ABS7FSG1_9ACTN|nr:hypothetical protein [Actinomadura parmotrematis]MBW8483236.1 hypothetical protein [Actinomadura parmotrematis]
MEPSRARYELLVRLAWALRAAPVAVSLVLPRDAEPVLFVYCRDGQRDAVLAVERREAWRVCWRGAELGVHNLEDVAHRIALDAAA